MTIEELQAAFDKFADDYIKFVDIPKEHRLSNRPDLCAFLLLDRLVPNDRYMVSHCEHDEFFVDVSPEELAAVATNEDIHSLIRCGVRYDSHYDSLAMFT